MKKIIVSMTDEKNEFINNIKDVNGNITIFGETYNFIGYSNGQKLYEHNGQSYTQMEVEQMVGQAVMSSL